MTHRRSIQTYRAPPQNLPGRRCTQCGPTTTITEIACETSEDNDVEHDALEMQHPNVDGSTPRELLPQVILWPDAVSTFAPIGNVPAHTSTPASPTNNLDAALPLSAAGDKRNAPQRTSKHQRITPERANVRTRWSKKAETKFPTGCYGQRGTDRATNRRKYDHGDRVQRIL